MKCCFCHQIHKEIIMLLLLALLKLAIKEKEKKKKRIQELEGKCLEQ
ncbi:hypothetical protein GLYMA_13G266350v4 [Glycine max]|nr:hypothetical protein GYH30_037476 [Glycine max]KRH21787.2 hypothetical protein GLYMA_13G266350v4 [Glycine max]